MLSLLQFTLSLRLTIYSNIFLVAGSEIALSASVLMWQIPQSQNVPYWHRKIFTNNRIQALITFRGIFLDVGFCKTRDVVSRCASIHTNFKTISHWLFFSTKIHKAALLQQNIFSSDFSPITFHRTNLANTSLSILPTCVQPPQLSQRKTSHGHRIRYDCEMT